MAWTTEEKLLFAKMQEQITNLSISMISLSQGDAKRGTKHMDDFVRTSFEVKEMYDKLFGKPSEIKGTEFP